MPMFDDPRKELRRLEEELLAAEYEEEEYDEFEDDYGFEEYDEDAELLAEARALIGEDEDIPIRPRRRNPAVDFSRMVYDDEEFDEDAAVLVDQPKQKGIGGLVVLAVLELMGILAVVGWWVQWLL